MPVTTEEDWPVGTFVRLNGPELFGLDLAVLGLTTGVLGGAREVRRLGLASIAAQRGPFELPVIEELVVDARRDDELAVHRGERDRDLGPIVFEATFFDAHPREWREPLHQAAELVLFATPRPFLTYDTTVDALAAGWIGRVGLVVFEFDAAIGTRMRSPSAS